MPMLITFTLRFFAYAQNDQMPLRKVTVDWGDGSNLSGDNPNTIHRAAEENLDMRILAKLLIHRMRVILLMRFAPPLAEVLSKELTEADLELAKAISKNPGINSETMRALLEAYSQMAYATVPHLPLELAILEIGALSSAVAQPMASR